jgi:hypothetical protein
MYYMFMCVLHVNNVASNIVKAKFNLYLEVESSQLSLQPHF